MNRQSLTPIIEADTSSLGIVIVCLGHSWDFEKIRFENKLALLELIKFKLHT